MINNSNHEKWTRLESKQLDNQFMNNVIQGLNCSPFEAKAILDTVHKVYGDFFDCSIALKPGQAKFVVISAENGPSKKLKDAQMTTVTLTLDGGQEDLIVKKQGGVIALRRHRLQRICNEAIMQGGLLTVEDLSNRILLYGERTIVRDIKALKEQSIVLPLRSTIKDIGRSLTHRTIIIKHWLLGKEYSDIARFTCHSIDAINNYVHKFKQVVSLANDGYDIHTISFLTKLSRPLVEQYVQLWHHLDIIPGRRQEVESLLKKNHP
jgi:hypothetical protein